MPSDEPIHTQAHMYVLLYLPELADPEVFGSFPTPQKAINVLRRISAAAGTQIDLSHSALATIDVTIDRERHRYQLLKMGSTDQLDIHADMIEELRATTAVSVGSRLDLPPQSQLSGY